MRLILNVHFLALTLLSVPQFGYTANLLTTPALQQAIEAYAEGNYSKALPIFEAQAQSGNVLAQFALAKMYRFGQGVEINYPKALSYYQDAAQGSYGVAQSHLGEMYEQGLGTDKNLSLAKSWYQIACANTCSEGCLNLQRLQDQEH